MYKFLTILIFFYWDPATRAQEVQYDQLNRLIAFSDSTKADEIIVIHKDSLWVHWKRSNFINSGAFDNLTHCNTPYMGTASMVKSWTGLLIGILIDKGFIKSVDDFVCMYMPDWKLGCENKITVRHLLTMTGGFKRLGGAGVLSKSDMNHFVLNLKPDTLPGLKFSYSNESVQILGMLAERVTRHKGDELFDTYLFKPLMMDSTSFAKDSAGNVIFYGGCTTTLRNASKIGQLMLHKGEWNGQQIVSKKWVEESTSVGPLAAYYGYLWWIDNNSKYRNFAATGDLGQMTIVFPELDLVFARRQSCDVSPSSLGMKWMGPDFLKLIYSIVDK